MQRTPSLTALFLAGAVALPAPGFAQAPACTQMQVFLSIAPKHREHVMDYIAPRLKQKLGVELVAEAIGSANMVERVRNRALTDKTVADSFGTMDRVELLKRLDDADIAFAEVNTMADLAVHPHLRRIEVDTPNGKVSYAAPAAIFVGEERHYGAVPAIGEHAELPKTRSPKP